MTNLINLMPMTTLFSAVSLINTKKSLLLCLLNLEIMMISLIIITLLMSYVKNSTEVLNTLILLSFSVSEASLGLACLVKTLRMEGNDNLKSFSITKS